jgi:hypothetical protein
MKRMKRQATVVGVIGAGLIYAMAASADPYNPAERAIGGGLLGAGTGAVIGAIAGGGRGLGAVAGAATTPGAPARVIPPPPPLSPSPLLSELLSRTEATAPTAVVLIRPITAEQPRRGAIAST